MSFFHESVSASVDFDEKVPASFYLAVVHFSFPSQPNRDWLAFVGTAPDFQVYLGSISRDVRSCTHWLRPRNPPYPPALGLVFEGAIGQQR
jgi:hypothetical protein